MPTTLERGFYINTGTRLIRFNSAAACRQHIVDNNVSNPDVMHVLSNGEVLEPSWTVIGDDGIDSHS